MSILGIQNSAGLLPHSIQEARRAQAAAEGEAPKKGAGLKEKEPRFDEYVPEDASLAEPIGLYRIEADGEGTPRIAFDDPSAKEREEAPAAHPQKPENAKQEEKVTGNTDQVDREIEKLKKRQKQLKQQAEREDDPARKEQLERQLAQVETELRQKDNDTYRRQHMQVTRT